MNNQEDSKTHPKEDKEKLSDTKTTGSGITELDHETLDGNNSETPFDPEHPDFPDKE